MVLPPYSPASHLYCICLSCIPPSSLLTASLMYGIPLLNVPHVLHPSLPTFFMRTKAECRSKKGVKFQKQTCSIIKKKEYKRFQRKTIFYSKSQNKRKLFSLNPNKKPSKKATFRTESILKRKFLFVYTFSRNQRKQKRK